MGTFAGHAIPGTFFVCFGVWWTIQIFHRYYSCRRRKVAFFSAATFPCICLCGRLKDWPIEGMVKLVFVSIGFTGEIITGFSDGKFVIIGNGQHATMFFFFGINGVVDILTYFRAPMPPKIEYVSQAMAFMCEALLFKFHLHGRTELDVLVHILLLYAIYACILALIVDMKYGHYVLSPLARAYFVTLQGTWFWQVGFILYNPISGAQPWKADDHEQMMIATFIFASHAGVIFLLMLLTGGVIACINQRICRVFDADVQPLLQASELETMEGNYTRINAGGTHLTVLSIHDDSESDLDIRSHETLK